MQDIVAPVIQKNVCWAHSEAILLAMLADQDPEIRQRVIHKIQDCRSEADDNLRPYHIPNINFHATDICWFNRLVDTNCHRATAGTTYRSAQPSVIGDKIPAYLVHTLFGELAVQIGTQAAIAVVSREARHGYICARLKHHASIRFHMLFDQKRDFVFL